MKIPKTFCLFGKTWKVKQLWTVDAEDSRGECDYSHSSISVKRNLEQSEKEVVLIHEILHAALDSLEYEELSNDEVLIERLSKALHQILTTAK